MLITVRPLGDLGRVQNTFCSEADKVLDAIEVALGEAMRVGLEGTVAYETARKLYDRETWSVGKVATGGELWDRPTEPVLPSTCARLVGELRGALDALNGSIASSGGTTAAPPPPEGSLWDSVKWPVYIASGVGVLFAVGYVVRAFR